MPRHLPAMPSPNPLPRPEGQVQVALLKPKRTGRLREAKWLCQKSQSILGTASWGSQRRSAQPHLTRGWSSASSEFKRQKENGIKGPLSNIENRTLCWQGLRTKGYRLKPWAC